MTTVDDLVPILKKLRLSGILDSYDLRKRQAVDDDLGLDEFLFRLLSDEVERRDGKQLHLRLRRASFEHGRTVEDFDFHFNPGIPKAKVIDLATCQFVTRREVVCLVGPTGVGKSHLAQALGHRACMAGRTALYVSAHQMLDELHAARADQSWDRRMLRFVSPELLIIDDLGLRPLRQDEPQDLYEVIRRRYERGAMVITSNREVKEWYPLFGDPLLASAAMDRLLHHAHVIEMDGDSYRNPPPAKRARKGGASPTAAATR
jgi:DNA replication protein DnaC